MTLYLILIALTGSILVFESELTGLALPAVVRSTLPENPMSIPAVISRVEKVYPGAAIDSLTIPSRRVPAYQLVLRLPNHQ
ncbi:MAG: hypothetical protein ACRYHB_12675, partial [Janthinobacterium lividum]